MNKYLTLLILIFTFQANAELYVVVSQNSPITEGEISDISDIADVYLGRKKVLGNTYINEVLDRTGEQRQRFFQRVTNMRENQVNAYWAKLKFSGSMRAPEQIDSESGMYDKLLSNPQAVGYTTTPPPQGSGVRVVLEINE